MSGVPDNELLALSARYSYKPDLKRGESLDEIRRKGTEIREKLVGKHVDDVLIEDTEFGRSFTPKTLAEGARKIVLYVHGGGWRICNVITHTSIMTDLAALSGREVFGLSYPLAPENPHPAAINTLCDKVVSLAESEGCEIVLAGDSAGANLALAIALRLRDEGRAVHISALLLYYGCYRRTYNTRSHLAYGDGTIGLASAWMKELWDFYIPAGTDPRYADLEAADLSGLPPVYICEAECDCLADDSRWLANRLIESGVPHFYDFYAGVNHGFIHFSNHYEPSYRALQSGASFLAMQNS